MGLGRWRKNPAKSASAALSRALDYDPDDRPRLLHGIRCNMIHKYRSRMWNAWPSLETFEMILCEWRGPHKYPVGSGFFPLGIDSDDLCGLVPCCLGGAPNLTSFHLCPGTLLPRGFFHAFVRGCPLIEVVIIDWLVYSAHRDLPELRALKLRELRLRSAYNYDPEQFSLVLRGQKRLGVLDLRRNFVGYSSRSAWNGPFTWYLVSVVSRECPNIREVHLDVTPENIPYE